MTESIYIDEPKFECILEHTGRALLTSRYTYVQDFMEAADAFSFVYYSSTPSDLDGLECQPVEIRVNDRTQMVGRIDATESGDQGSAVQCEGRDYLADPVECNIDPKAFLADGMSLEKALLYLLAPCGITAIETQGDRISKRTGKPITIASLQLDAKLIKELRPSAGRGIFEVCEEMLARFGLTMQPALRRNAVVIQEPTYNQDPMGRIERTTANPNTNLVVGGRARRDYSSFPTHCVFTGKQGKPEEVGGAKGNMSRWDMSEWIDNYPAEIQRILKSVIIQGRRPPGDNAAAELGALYRLLYFRDDKVAKTKEQLDNAMMRAICDRLKETLSYTCTLRGHINPVTGYNWSIDTIVEVNDEQARVFEPLWIHRMIASNSKTEGPTTQLSMMRPSTFQIFWEEATGGKLNWKPRPKVEGWKGVEIPPLRAVWL